MATLTITSIPDSLYQRLQTLAEQENRTVDEVVIRLLEKAEEQERPHSILELCGLGKALWETTDAVEYVRAERDSWDS